MNYLFIIDPPEKLALYKDTSALLMKECLRQKINIFYTTCDAISIDSTQNIEVECSQILTINETITASKKSKNTKYQAVFKFWAILDPFYVRN